MTDTTNAGLERLLDALRTAVPGAGVATDAATLAIHSSDLSYRPSTQAIAVLRPACLEDLAQSVATATGLGHAVIGRGGGMSYTSGYTPERPGSVIVDMRDLNRIVEINERDMYVTVEAGATWMDLNAALEPRGLRTPYWGPLSGRYATIGGTLSQNSLYHGSGVHHTVAESVLGLKVILADGTVLTTGSGANRNSLPFFRNFGPDATGLFLGDTGAFGIKAQATLRLITRPTSTGHLSFRFETLAGLVGAQTRLARLGIASECVGFDRSYNQSFQRSGVTFEQGLSIVGRIARKGGLKGLGQAARVAIGGKGVLEDVPYSLHVTIDGLTDTVVAEHVDLAAEVCVSEGGTEMLNSIPTVMRNEPFGAARPALMNQDGQVWVAVHGFFPLSRGLDVAVATERMLGDQATELARHGIGTRFLSCFSGSELLIETIIDWTDELGPLRMSLIEPEYQAKWGSIPADTGRRARALALRDAVRDLYQDFGGINLQIGKYYPYLELMNNEALPQLLRSVKAAVDPRGLMNPGALGLR